MFTNTPTIFARNTTRVFVSACLLCLALPTQASAQEVRAQTNAPWENYNRPQAALMFGMIQPVILRGGNIEGDFAYKRLVVGYSHGFNLDFEGSTVTGEASEQGLSFRMPFTTGFGVGVRLLEWLDVRFEAKIHRFEVREASTDTTRLEYTTSTLGAGIYARYRPLYHFGLASHTPTWTHGFTIAPSLRFWPNVWSSLKDNQATYDNQTTGQREVHTALRAGIANSPIIANVGLGYLVTF